MKTIEILIKSFFIAGLLLPFTAMIFLNPTKEDFNACLFIGITSGVCLLFIYLVSRPLKD